MLVLKYKEAIHVDIVTSDLLVIEFADNEEKEIGRASCRERV